MTDDDDNDDDELLLEGRPWLYPQSAGFI